MQLPFHSYRLRSRKAAQTRLLNCYAQQMPPEGRSPLMVKGMAGIKSFVNIAESPQRAGIQFSGNLYSVAGNTFYRVASDGSKTSLGTVAGTGNVDIAKNTSQLAILINSNLWVYQGSLTQVTDPDFTSRGARRMAVMDNYGGFIEPSSGRWFICDLNNFTVFDPLDFATAESAPDNLVSIEPTIGQFFLLGEDSCELWDNVGGSGFPFLRAANGIVECGCGSERGSCKADNTIYWIDQNRMARRLEGNIARRISHEGMEERWQDYSTISDCYVFSYIFDGHTFVVYTFPTAGATWVYDINTQEWHERQSYGYDHWRAAWVVNAYNKTFVGDTQSGNIGEIHSTTYTEWGGILSREATTGPVYAKNRKAFFDRLDLDMEVGQGTETGQGSNPVVMLDVSDDGGVNFRALPNKSIGTTGQTRKLVHWDGMGSSRERVHRIRVTDPVPFNINAARLDVRL